ncbi:MAG: radical SAM protein [Nanoarchaeota archaeon]|nr:radical SAM protein [Nanoarchaeota archaeon]MBU1322228.1 radical SAM protein [Nanoarchaeota archaeon]MBU1597769.1 radical SAM protein [Nanoarchaeota archaeon]MBU2442033.1 radical SAM protein [Nanoarchaeota archaeon]
MNIETLSIVAGTEACNARCPYCISKMTPKQGICTKEQKINFRNLHKGALLAKEKGATTVIITGKGEPVLFPEQITKYLDALEGFNFPFIELQTNGILLHEQKEKYMSYLYEWYDKGMTTIIISIAHYEAEKNRQILVPHKKQYIDLVELIDMLHEIGFSVRLACMMVKGYVDCKEEIEKLIKFSKENMVEQLSIRNISKPEKSINKEIYDWTINNSLSKEQLEEITNYIKEKGALLLEFNYGGSVYDVDGQNVCLTNCLTLSNNPNQIRQLIFFPDGHLRYDWQYKGAILL